MLSAHMNHIRRLISWWQTFGSLELLSVDWQLSSPQWPSIEDVQCRISIIIWKNVRTCLFLKTIPQQIEKIYQDSLVIRRKCACDLLTYKYYHISLIFAHEPRIVWPKGGVLCKACTQKVLQIVNQDNCHYVYPCYLPPGQRVNKKVVEFLCAYLPNVR